ncbi:hypothetical protein IQ241_06095 [Romeria aff. gracilis LEGE 07310]|uniref:Tetratricopeptide repeat protein n=1 Tax=Vasconcelosia minhoensis LEGE 07310 TaxID=915328 RepID=A0A8J7DBT5_9CYAN|nr:hypothetical protein [Romeria gracilis]MBE9076868.1 hypothetical protein [Romeria aff. gracilis LEGE 07310]
MNIHFRLRHLDVRLRPVLRPLQAIACQAALLLTLAQPSLAQSIDPQLRQDFLSDPLTETPRDPLLPSPVVERPLSPLERSRLSQALDELNREAQQRLAVGQVDAAFEIWRRELRLRRALGRSAELAAISRVGPIAWQQERPVEVQLLTLRLREIVTAAQPGADEDRNEIDEDEDVLAPPLNEAQLETVAETFRVLRAVDDAIAAYEQLAQLAADRGDGLAQRRRLNILAQIHLDWFRFADAAEVYRRLLADARIQNSLEQQEFYLIQLVYSYQQGDSLTNAIRAQTDLLAVYQRQGRIAQYPPLELAIARNYRDLNRPNDAIAYYRAAYVAAQQLQQFSFASQVLQDLGQLYATQGQTEEALLAYNLLVKAEQQSYNTYGEMNAYDAIGQLQRSQGNSFEALQAFERGLVLANRLSYRQDYFTEQIEQVNQQL